MDFKVFLKKARDESFWKESYVFCFQGSEYPYSFFYELLRLLEDQKLLPSPLEKLSGTALDSNQLAQRLNQSLLGQYSFYWLGSLDQERPKTKEKMLDFLSSYVGQNRVAFFVSDQAKIPRTQNVVRVLINQKISFSEFKELVSFFSNTISPEKLLLVKRFFSKMNVIPFHVAYSFLRYLELINTRLVEQLFSYLSDNLLGMEPSLFQLSEYFFSLKPRSFFKLWSCISSNYPDMFWLAYWSEQLWRAYHVGIFLKNNEFAQAKKMSFRLPYGYLKKDWKRVNGRHLINLFEQLYSIDFARKKGIVFSGALDLVFCKHFLHYK